MPPRFTCKNHARDNEGERSSNLQAFPRYSENLPRDRNVKLSGLRGAIGLHHKGDVIEEHPSIDIYRWSEPREALSAMDNKQPTHAEVDGEAEERGTECYGDEVSINSHQPHTIPHLTLLLSGTNAQKPIPHRIRIPMQHHPPHKPHYLSHQPNAHSRRERPCPIPNAKPQLGDQDQSKDDSEDDVACESGDVRDVCVAEGAGGGGAEALRGEEVPAFVVRKRR